MLRISKLTDYGTVVLAHLANTGPGLASATEVAAATGLGLPTVSKLLKTLAKSGMVRSTRGSQGGYKLAREASEISAADVIDALEGPVSITECSGHDSHCGFESTCNVGNAWQRINVAIRRALDEITLSDLLRSHSPVPHFEFAGTPISVEAGKLRKSGV
jgi:FeS assembly SUF system regulator